MFGIALESRNNSEKRKSHGKIYFFPVGFFLAPIVFKKSLSTFGSVSPADRNEKIKINVFM